ncbi:hypothetical protein KUV73_03015 [Mameliella alba]|nr:hypothetical protein [Mameliella alba]MBY6168292.1 hypothetical protein [Mameliella alba]MBY6173313.1 hypothetical protein [Mameliella alba]
MFRTTAFALFLATPVLAWEHTAEWRFSGDEIRSFSVTEPAFDEDPVVLEVELAHESSGTTRIMIEADNGIGDCADLLRFAQGNPFEIIVLTANLNAQTINGVTLAQCSTR